MNPKYCSYYFSSSHFRQQLRRHITTSKVSAISPSRLAGIQIPIPSIVIQEYVARTLDLFEEMVTNLSTGLPAELTARRKQYEYYRDKLLTFEETA
jgi:type I restriction enzyme S subunit